MMYIIRRLIIIIITNISPTNCSSMLICEEILIKVGVLHLR